MESLIESLNNSEQLEDTLKGLLIILSAESEMSLTLKCMIISNGTIQYLTNLLRRSWDKCKIVEDSVCKSSEAIAPGNIYGSRCKNTSILILALSCIYHICDGIPPSLYLKYVDKDFVSTLMRYIVPDCALFANPYSANHFFQFRSGYEASVKAAISSLKEGGYVMVSVDGEQASLLESHKETNDSDSAGPPQREEEIEFKFYEPLCYEILGKSIKIKHCQVLLPTKVTDLSLAELLISEGVAWPQGGKMAIHIEEAKLSKIRQSTNRSFTDLSKHVVPVQAKITHILSGNFFWAVIGREKICQFQQISRCLSHSKSQLVNVKPNKLDVITATVRDGSDEQLIRARVMEIEDGIIIVLDLDTGCVHRVLSSAIYNLPSSCNLIKHPPLASLACLKGVSPMPLDTRAPELALGTLGLIVRYNGITTVNILFQSGILHALPDLITCPDLDVAYRALDLVVNLTSFRTQQVQSTPWYTLIPGTLATLQRCMQRTIEKRSLLNAKNTQSVKLSQTATLPKAPNSLPLPRNGDDISYSELHSLVSITWADVRINAVVESCIACLANSMFMSTKGKSLFYQHRGLDIVLQVFSLYYSHDIIMKLCAKALGNYVYFNRPTNPHLKGHRYRGYKNLLQASESTPEENISLGVKTVDITDSDDSSGDNLSSSDVLTESFSSFDTQESSSFTSEVSQGSRQLPTKFYIRGDKLQLTQDAAHELQLKAWPTKQEFSAIICGFLNTGRMGTIYLGLDPKDSAVVGLELDRDARDEMRMSVDHLMVECLTPSVLHLQFDVEFIPVMDIPAGIHRKYEQSCADSKQDEVSPSMFHLGHDYVVEIQVKPLPNVIYCCNGDECFYRLDGNTVILDSQLIRQLIVLEEEAEHVEEIVELQQELEALKAEVS